MKKLIISTLLAICLIGIGTQVSAGPEKALFEKGVALLKQEKFQAAIDVFSELVALVPENPDVYKNRGVAHMKLNQYDLAIQDFEKTREIKPDLKGLYSNLGVAWYYKGNYSRAIKNYNMEIALTPDNYYAYFNRAICRSELEEIELSLEDVNTSLEIFPRFYLAQCLKGDLLVKSGNPLEAKQAYEKALAIDPGHPYAKEQLAGLKTDVASPPVKTDAETPEPAETAVKTGVVEKKIVKRPEKEAGQILTESKEISGYELQAGAFRSRENADKLYKKFNAEGYKVRIVELTRPSGIEWHLVRIGRYDTKAAAKAGLVKVKERMGMDIIVRPYGRF